MVKKVKKKIRDDLFSFYVGVALFIVFFVLWLFTAEVVDTPLNLNKTEGELENLDNLSAQEQINEIEENNNKIEDESNFDIARVTNNTYYCDLISDKKLRRQCFDEITGDYIEPEEDTRTKTDVEDESAYSIVLVTGDKSHCEDIVNEELKEECLNLEIEESEEDTTQDATSDADETQTNDGSDSESDDGSEEEVSVQDESAYSIVLVTGDKSYCEDITDEQLKEECINLDVEEV